MRDRSRIVLSMNRLDTETRIRVISALVEGCSLRSTCRMTGVAMNTVLKLLADLGAACDEYQDKKLRGLAVKRVQCDEIWSFCYAKERNVPERFKDQEGYGSVWTWTAIDADTKLMLTWFIGARDAACANSFMLDVASRIEGRYAAHHGRPEGVPLGHRAGVPGRLGRLRAAGEGLRGPVGRQPGQQVQPADLLRRPQGAAARVAGPGPHLDQLRRAPKPHDPHVKPQVYAADQRRTRRRSRTTSTRPR